MLGPVVVDLQGTELTAAERNRLLHPLVGMVILFSRNFASAGQLAELTGQIRALRDPPLLIAVDHEGGRVQRFRASPFSRVPAMAQLGRLWDRDVLLGCRTAASIGYLMAAELRAFGVDLTFAPVLDLDWQRSGVIGDRALHRDARVVTMLANHLCHGMVLAGMANCGKHFPGHGWAEADSHTELPRDERSLAEILDDDAAPYRWMGPTLTGVMPAHVVYPAIDRLPAGFSAKWIGQILRGELGFTGAVFSDDLSMAGARVAGDIVQGAQLALEAGSDYVLVCNDPDAADRVLAELKWSASTAFSERAARLTARGPALPIERLQVTELYQRALADLRAVQELPA